MFGIGFPEMVVIIIIALLVVGPDKLPDFARTTAKTLAELKRSAEGLKASLVEESGAKEVIDEFKPGFEETARTLQGHLENLPNSFYVDSTSDNSNNPEDAPTASVDTKNVGSEIVENREIKIEKENDVQG